MTKEKRIKLAIQKGFIYNAETGLIYSPFGKIITAKTNGYIKLYVIVNKKFYQIGAHQFAWYCVYKECVDQIDHVN